MVGIRYVEFWLILSSFNSTMTCRNGIRNEDNTSSSFSCFVNRNCCTYDAPGTIHVRCMILWCAAPCCHPQRVGSCVSYSYRMKTVVCIAGFFVNCIPTAKQSNRKIYADIILVPIKDSSTIIFLSTHCNRINKPTKTIQFWYNYEP